MTSFTKDLCFELETVIKSAGEIIMEGARKLTSNDIMVKGDANFVTEYDIAVQKYLVEKLAEILPKAAFLAEEDEDRAGLSENFTIVIDPIDGTANFMYDIMHSAISVGIYENKQPVFGAVYNPYTKEYFHAVKNEGAYLNGKRIAVSERTGEATIIAFGSSPYYKKTLGKQTAKLMYELLNTFGDVRRFGSAALDLCYVAAGRFDGFCEAKLSPWDFAAGELIVTEAGGVVSNFKGEILKRGSQDSVLAASRAVYDKLCDITKKMNI